MTNKTKMKNITFMIIAGMGLSACEPKQSPAITVVTSPAPDVPATPQTPTDPATTLKDETQAKVADPVAALVNASQTPVKPVLCIPRELRTDYSTAIPSSGSALYTALIHDGVSGRQADPMCFMNSAVVSNGHTYIPCAIHSDSNAFAGNIYGRKWADADRVWVKGAVERQVFLANATAQEVGITIGVVDSASVFYSNVAWRGHGLVVISVDTTAVDFNGYCQ